MRLKGDHKRLCTRVSNEGNNQTNKWSEPNASVNKISMSESNETSCQRGLLWREFQKRQNGKLMLEIN